MKAGKTLDAINAAYEVGQEMEHRGHLGASIIGEQCPRKLWYIFRWAAREFFSGRMLRLFERGHKEEERFAGYLRKIGATVLTENPENGKQWRISNINGHFGGDTDGVGHGIPDLPPGTWFDCEFKTHNNKSYNSIVKEGLCQAHPKHFAQIQTYMHGLKLNWGLYMAVNKDTDDLHLELIQANAAFANNLLAKAERIIGATEAPPRISGNQGVAFWLCRFCKFKAICHEKAPPERNCRTCHFSRPIEGGQWLCTRYNYVLNKAEQHKACADWTKLAGFDT